MLKTAESYLNHGKQRKAQNTRKKAKARALEPQILTNKHGLLSEENGVLEPLIYTEKAQITLILSWL